MRLVGVPWGAPDGPQPSTFPVGRGGVRVTRAGAKRVLREELAAEEGSLAPASPNCSRDGSEGDVGTGRMRSEASVDSGTSGEVEAGQKVSPMAVLPTPADKSPSDDKGEGTRHPPTGAQLPPSLKSLLVLVAIQLQWAQHQLQALTTHAPGGFRIASKVFMQTFHPLGNQYYLLPQGAIGTDEGGHLAGIPAASREASANDPKGLFSHHRMVAYRSRCLQIIRQVVGDLSLGSDRAGADKWSPSPRPVALVDNIVPRIDALSAVAKLSVPKLVEEIKLEDDEPTKGSQAIDPVRASNMAKTRVSSSSVARCAKSPLASLLPGSNTVKLTLKVLGYNLHCCRQAVVVCGSQQYFYANIPPVRKVGSTPELFPFEQSTVRVQQPPGDTRARDESERIYRFSAPFRVSLRMLHALKHTVIGALGSGWRKLGKLQGWQPPRAVPTELSLCVSLPRSLVEVALDYQKMHPWGAGHCLSRATDGPTEQVILQLQSDFHTLSIPVWLVPRDVLVVGTSGKAAHIMARILSGKIQLQPTQNAAPEGVRKSAGRWLMPPKWSTQVFWALPKRFPGLSPALWRQAGRGRRRRAGSQRKESAPNFSPSGCSSAGDMFGGRVSALEGCQETAHEAVGSSSRECSAP